MKTNTSLYWIFLCFVIISSCGSTKHTQREAPIPEPETKSATSSNMTETEKYIYSYKYLAIKEMQRAKIPASITLAQAILESSVGQSYIARNANNHFGIKCNSKWTGPTINYDDDTANECFRSYSSVEQSFIDHSDHLSNNPRYANLFTLEITDYKGWATGLKAAGYATRSNYGELLIGIIDRYQLYEYDKFQSNKPKSTEKSAQFVYNGLPAVMVREGDTYDDITRDNKISMEKLVKYNDLAPDQPLHQDMILYLKAKKSKGKESYHIVKDGESMYEISQDYAVKLDNLLSMNLMTANETPAVGEIIYLKQKRSDPPALQQNVAKTDAVKSDEVQETVFNDNQKKAIESNNDFVMTKKDAEPPVVTPPPAQVEPVQTAEQPAVAKSEVKQDVVTKVDNSDKSKVNAPENELLIAPAKSTTTTAKVIEPSASNASATDYHIVQKGETMFSISKLYGMKVNELQSLNGMSDYSLNIGQKLIVNKNTTAAANQQVNTAAPAVKTASNQQSTATLAISAKPAVTSANIIPESQLVPVDTSKKLKDTVYHVVQQGETFYSISRQYNVKISDIIAWNHYKEYKLEVGKKIVVGAPEPKAPADVPTTTGGTLLVPLNTGQSATSPGTTLVDGKYHIVQPKQTLFSISKMYNTTVDNIKEWNSLPDNSISIGQKLRVKP